MRPRVLLQSPLGPFSGYGNDGLGLTAALLGAGWDVRLLPYTVVPPLPVEVAGLLTLPAEAPFDLTIVHVDPMVLELSQSAKRATSRAIAWSMWEWPSFAFEPEIMRTLPARLEFFDEIVVYDKVTREAFVEALGSEERIRVVQGGFWSDDWPIDRSRDWFAEVTRFGMVGALHDRKNPFAAIRAFAELREEHGDEFKAELHLKTVTRTLHPAIQERYPGVIIHYEVWPQERLREFYGSLHCLLAPSRGEGKNLPCLEAQSTGCPVIASDWGGHQEWLSDQWAYPLRVERVEHPSGKVWAEPDVGHLKELMWEIHINRAEARRRGELAARTIPSMADWTRVLERLVR